MDLPTISLIVASIAAAVGTGALLNTMTRQRGQDWARLHEDMEDCRERLTVLETQMGPLWQIIRERLADMLKRPTHHEMDHLLDKFRSETITLEDARRLRQWLDRVFHEPERYPGEKFVNVLVTAALAAHITRLERETAKRT